MYLYGAGGHAKVIIDILRANRVSVSGIFDDNSQLTILYGCDVLGKYKGQTLSHPLIVSIGNNEVRATLTRQLKVEFGVAAHPSAIVSPSSSVGEGTVIMQGAILQADTKIGKHVIINTNASVDHDCTIEDFVHISPGAVLCGHVKIGEGTIIGAGTVVTPGVKIGRWCRVKAASVITNDIPDNASAPDI